MTRTRTTRTSTRTTPTRTPTTQTSSDSPGGSVGQTTRALARAIEPLSRDEFFASYWERHPYLALRGEPGRFDDLLSEGDVERLVCTAGIRYPAFRLVKDGEKLPVTDYTEDVPWRPAPFTATADVDRVLAEFERGATIVLQGLHLHWEPLAVFCRELEIALGHPVQANAYYTPRGSQGLPVHHDTHDVFSLQVAGEKRWLVYEPVFPLPLKEQRYSPELGTPGDPVHDVTLAPGDTLYLPRGWLHEAETSRTDSLHVTVGVSVYTWLDAFRSALDECAADLAFRRAVRSDDVSPAADLLGRLRERLGADDVARRRRARFVRSRRPIRGGQIRSLRALDRLTLDSLVERRATVVSDVDSADGRVVVWFEGKALTFPEHARAEVAYAASSNHPFRPSDLPGELDERGRLVLVRRLVREGLLRFTDEERDGPSRSGDGGVPGAPPST